MRCSLSFSGLMLATMMLGCGEDPAKSVPNVAASPAKPVPSETTKPTEVKETATAPAAPAGALVFSGEGSKIVFVGSKKVGGAHNGGFKSFTGHVVLVVLVEGKPEVKSISVDIDTNSLFSDDEKLTGHLKNADFFDTPKFPAAKFVTTEIKPGGDKGATHTLVGNLSLHGETKSITIPAIVKMEGGTLTLKSEFAINKNDFGITFAGPGNVIREEVVIKLDVKADKKS